MKNIASSVRVAFAAAGIFLLSGGLNLVRAQGPGSTGPTPTNPTAPTAVPIDGGASLLLAAGVGLGLKKLRDRRRGK